MDGGAWWATVHGVAKSWTRLNDLIGLRPPVGETVLQNFLKDHLPGYNPHIGLNKIFHFFLRSTID